MDRHFDTELQKLKDLILSMGGNVEQAIEHATQALLLREPERLDRVFELETQVNKSHLLVDETCLNLLARQAPMANDLRMIIAIMKINTDLERMGDQAVNIAHNSKRYLAEPPLKPLIDLPRMAEDVRSMVRDSLDSLVKRDPVLATEVLNRDDRVDAFKNQIFRELITYMIGDPRTIERALNLILIARNLERVGDHATNIAEDVIFAITGRDVRHGAGGAGQ
jgi:phosphate transport system protein